MVEEDPFGADGFGSREEHLVELTNEIHGHIGIYSILGAKMGLRAVELLESGGQGAADTGARGADTHSISIVSYAGNNPPVSCLNDGLQISTGATLGRGRIRVPDTTSPRAEAEFHCGSRTLRLRLKPEYESRIQADITLAVERYGHTPAYWNHVQQLALQYQRTWRRDAIFSLDLQTELPGNRQDGD